MRLNELKENIQSEKLFSFNKIELNELFFFLNNFKKIINYNYFFPYKKKINNGRAKSYSSKKRNGIK